MNQTVDHGSVDDADRHDHRQTAVKRIAAGEHFPARCLEWIERSHSREDHRSISEGIDPCHLLETVVTSHAPEKREADKHGRCRKVPGDPAGKRAPVQERLFS